MKKLCNGWEFTPMWTNGFRLGEGDGEPVRLPLRVYEQIRKIIGYKKSAVH